jgi:hypothetical protein
MFQVVVIGILLGLLTLSIIQLLFSNSHSNWGGETYLGKLLPGNIKYKPRCLLFVGKNYLNTVLHKSILNNILTRP